MLLRFLNRSEGKSWRYEGKLLGPQNPLVCGRRETLLLVRQLFKDTCLGSKPENCG